MKGGDLLQKGTWELIGVIEMFYIFFGGGLRCSVQASHCSGFSCCGAQALGVHASVVAARGLSSCGSRALERRLSSCGARA